MPHSIQTAHDVLEAETNKFTAETYTRNKMSIPGHHECIGVCVSQRHTLLHLSVCPHA